MKPKLDYSLYLVTDRDQMSTTTLEQAVEQAIIGGCTLIQLRKKKSSARDFYATAVAVKQITDHFHIPLIINDRVDIAWAVQAAGVHIGQHDLPAAVVRKMIGDQKMVGVTVASLHQAQQAYRDGADYLGIVMFATATKPDAEHVTMATLNRIKTEVHLPIIVIRGMNKTTIPHFSHTGIDGIAVVSAILSEKNIALAAQQLKKLVMQTMHDKTIDQRC